MYHLFVCQKYNMIKSIKNLTENKQKTIKYQITFNTLILINKFILTIITLEQQLITHESYTPYNKLYIMLTYLLPIALIITTTAFNINQLPTISQTPQSPSPLLDCSTGQTTAVASVIATCEVSDLDTTTECISNQITKVYNSQQWNVFAKNSADNKDTVMFWKYNNCAVNLVNYGKFNRTYIIWPVKTYLNATKDLTTKEQQTIIRKGEFPKKLTSKITSITSLQSEPNADCPSWRKQTVNKIIISCSIDGNEAAARCIFDKVKQQMGEYWNVAIQTSIYGTSLNFFYYGGCEVQTDGSDSYRRYYAVFKAHA